MGWKIELERKIDNLSSRIREVEATLKKLSKPAPKKKPIKKKEVKASDASEIAEA